MPQPRPRIRVRLANGRTISGWLYAEGPAGIHVSLDAADNSIRFFPEGSWSEVEYVVEGRAGDVAPKGREAELDEQWRASFAAALDKLDYNKVRALQKEFAAAHNVLRAAEPERPVAYDHEVHAVLAARDAYAKLIKELDRSGLSPVLLDGSEALRRSAGPNTLPLIEESIATAAEVRELVNIARRENALAAQHLGRDLLVVVSEESLRKLLQPRERASKAKAPARKSRFAKPIRVLSAMLKVAAGGSLACADLMLGSLVGVVAVLPTVTLATVPTVLAVASSTFTGINGACDGIKAVAEVVESEEKSRSAT